jgi:cytochrome c
MKAILVSLTAASCVLLTNVAQADQALATAKGCMACHAVGTKIVGPAYKDVAKKYAGDKDAPAKLVRKVLDGGSGVWGPIQMPPNKTTANLSEADAKKLVAWILSQK